MRFKYLFLICVLGSGQLLAQSTPRPVLFFSDLTNGPATGNSDPTHTSNGGVYVTLYGNFFGTSPKITLNGASCLIIVSEPATWMWYQKMVVQLTSGCSSGDFAATTSAGTSNGLPFTINSGNIYYVSNSGNDLTGAGSFSAPWKTIPKAVQTAATGTAGNIIYVENGVVANTDDGQGWTAAVTFRQEWCQATLAAPNVLVAYPGAAVTVGSTSPSVGIDALRATGGSASGGPCMGRWTWAGMQLEGSDEAVSWNGPSSSYPTGGSYGWRLVGNDITCPFAAIATGCMHTANIDNNGSGVTNQILGNNFHDIGNLASQPNTDQQHGIYLGDQSRHFEVGWNTVSDVVACRGIQVYSNSQNEFDFTIHDNTIHDTTCDGIGIYTSDASLGSGIFVYNNVVYNVGKGPATAEGGGNFSCIHSNHETRSGTGSTGTQHFYNNTCYDAGSIQNPGFSSCDGFAASMVQNDDLTTSDFQNNILFQTGTNPACPSGLPYWTNDSSNISPLPMTGSSNIMWAINPAETPPPNNSGTRFSGTINSDPQLVNTSINGCPSSCPTDLHLSASGSPANGAGSTSELVPTYDHDGLVRPSPPSIGAYEFAAGGGGGSSRPNPPTNLTVTPH